MKIHEQKSLRVSCKRVDLFFSVVYNPGAPSGSADFAPWPGNPVWIPKNPYPL